MRVSGTGSRGTLLELREDRAVVDVGGVRLQLPPEDLEDLGPPEEEVSSPPSQASSWQGPEAEAETEIDLRGLRVTDVGLEVDRALDQALLGGLGEIRIIHGKGTGALREAVSELLATDARVREFGMAGPAQGGAGVTVVKLK